MRITTVFQKVTIWISFPTFVCIIFLIFGCKGTQTKSPGSPVSYRNLFLEAGYSADSVNKKVEQTFQQLFFGNPLNEAVYFTTGKNENGNLGYILDVNNNDVRSEGMSYGMMIAVQMNKKSVFDALWNWSKTYMHHNDPLHPAYGYFSWSLDTTGIAKDEMPAPDGEAYYATALYFAAKRWGNGKGIFDYNREATRLVHDMKNRKPITGLSKGRKMTGINLFDTTHAMVRFTPNLADANHTDASYHLPAFYEIWALKASPEDRVFWKRAADSSRAYFRKASHPVTGLSPDYGNFDGSAWAAPWRAESKTFSYDAWRSVMNWSVDWAWWKKEADAIQRSNRILAFFAQQGLKNYGNQYTLEGKILGSGQPTGIVACNATAALAANNEIAKEFVKEFWYRTPPTGPFRYYNGMLMMLGLLHCSGQFQMYL